MCTYILKFIMLRRVVCHVNYAGVYPVVLSFLSYTQI